MRALHFRIGFELLDDLARNSGIADTSNVRKEIASAAALQAGAYVAATQRTLSWRT
jgi:hypothetical protein